MAVASDWVVALHGHRGRVFQVGIPKALARADGVLGWGKAEGGRGRSLGGFVTEVCSLGVIRSS